MKKFILALSIVSFTISAEAACDQIGTVAELNAFAQKINGGETSACAELTSDVYFNGSASNQWNPIGTNDNPYVGTFDGKNHTIYGLYTKTDWEPAFVAKAANGAIIKNLNIAEAYFEIPDESKQGNAGDAGGLIGDVKSISGSKETTVTLSNCTFSGTVKIGSYAVNAGGLVGSIGQNASLTITDSYSVGNVLGSGTRKGGLVGYINNGSSLAMKNSYYTGLVDGSNVIVGQQDNSAGTVAFTNVACGVSGCASYKKDNGNVVTNDITVLSSNEEVVSSFWSGKILSDVESLLGSHPGVVFSQEGSKLVATLNDNDAVLKISREIRVDEVRFERLFTKNVFSTIMLPFEIAVGNVDNGEDVFASFTDVKSNTEGTAFTEVSGTKVESKLVAYTPYLLKSVGEKLNFSGSVTLKATPSVASSSANGWSFVGTIAKKRWENDAKGTPENADEIGRVYGFAGSDQSKTGYEIGTFVKAKNKVAIRPMRAYLIYNGSDPLPANKPAELGASYAPAAETASITNLPDSLKVVIVDAEEPEEEEITFIQPIKVPANIIKSDRWHDVVGRSMNKPKAQGAYLNNRTPVIVK